MATKEIAKEALYLAKKIWEGAFSIWGLAVGPAPTQYNTYGKPFDVIEDYAIHAYTSDPEDINRIPTTIQNVSVMVFVDIEKLEEKL